MSLTVKLYNKAEREAAEAAHVAKLSERHSREVGLWAAGFGNVEVRGPYSWDPKVKAVVLEYGGPYNYELGEDSNLKRKAAKSRAKRAAAARALKRTGKVPATFMPCRPWRPEVPKRLSDKEAAAVKLPSLGYSAVKAKPGSVAFMKALVPWVNYASEPGPSAADYLTAMGEKELKNGGWTCGCFAPKPKGASDWYSGDSGPCAKHRRAIYGREEDEG